MNAQKSGFILLLYFPLTYRAQQQNNAEATCSMAGISILIVLLIFVLFFIAVFMVLLWNRREIRLFGWLLRLDRCPSSEKNGKTSTKEEVRSQRISASNLTTLEPQNSVGKSYRYIGDSSTSPNDTESGTIISLNSGINQGFRGSPREHYEVPRGRMSKKQGSLYENQVLEHERSQNKTVTVLAKDFKEQSGRYSADSESDTTSNEIDSEMENSDYQNPAEIKKSSESPLKQSNLPTDSATVGRFCYENQVLEHERSNIVPYEDLKIERESKNEEYDGLRF